jgi:hypothetical protein
MGTNISEKPDASTLRVEAFEGRVPKDGGRRFL